MEQPELIEITAGSYGKFYFTEAEIDSYRPLMRIDLFAAVEKFRPIATPREAVEIVNALEDYIAAYPTGVKRPKPTRETMLKAMVELLETTAKGKRDFVQVAVDSLRSQTYLGDENVIRRVQRLAQIEMMKLNIRDLDKIREDLIKVLALDA